eukprot:TRINITY_DN11595_c0_g1_i1.p1 TRINITY_DN11595_c0_g1~~TRINITY_DN11595_c0_g1_i1.p1  ORF type:complete len:131 (+),score=34.54 TRINITY_DN11595_c0_g1_i1:41-394(+)
MSQSQAGIKQLLDAEKKADEIVAHARREKTQLLKRAREEAELEINEFRAFRNADFQRKTNQQSGDKDIYIKNLSDKTEEEIARAQEDASHHAEEVINLLLNYVTEVYTELPSARKSG